jgi:hydrogenase-4 component F
METTIAVPALTSVVLWCLPRRWTIPVAVAAGIATGGLAVAVATVALARAAHPEIGPWLVLDAAGGLLVGVIGVVGVISVLASLPYLATQLADPAGKGTRATPYFAVLYAFWATLLGVPVAGNLVVAWLLIEATTAASALLVGFSRRRRALEAGWKYLILTSLGLGVTLLGCALLAAGIPDGGLSGLSWAALPTYAASQQGALAAYLLILTGFAAKIGWAPVHNWLPDAHSEAPAPVSALLSAALLPAVVIVAWRCMQGLAPVVGIATTRSVLIGFGLASVAVAVPFLSRPLPWKRLLAYSSLEHMGVIALGIGFGTPLAIAGVAVHIVAHAIAKTLAFVIVTPLLAHEPRAARYPVTGIGRTSPALGVTTGVALGALAGLPPSPLFASELLIIAGGFQSGRLWAAAAAALLLALAFLGLTHALLETTAGETSECGSERGRGRLPGIGGVTALAVVSVVFLLALTCVSIWLPGTDLVQALMEGLA